MKNTFLLVFSFLLLVGSLRAQTVDVISADDLYNQGNKAYNEDNFGDAVYYFEKALILNPKAEDIKINLRLAEERLDADIIELDSFFLSNWWKNIRNTFMPGTWKILSLLFLIGLLTLLYILLLGKKKFPRSKVYIGIGALTFLLLLSIFSGISRSNDIFNNEYAVIHNNVDALHQGPDPVSEKIKPVVNGVKIKILDQSGAWYKVSTMDSEQGWILKDNVRLLKF